MRLNRYLASAGLGSRRSCEELITTGRVTVNGKIVTDLATLIKETDHVSVDGKKEKTEEPCTLVMFKPEGVLCSRDAQGRRKTVFDLLPENTPRLFYVGRLDMDSEGLLIMTNRGELAEQLTHPRFKLPKTYHVELDKDFDFTLVPRFLKGFLIEPGYAQAEAVYKIGHNRVKVVLTQGLKRQIRLMFLKFGYRVKFLRRIQVGELTLGNMKPGEWRMLNDYEIDKYLVNPTRTLEPQPRHFAELRETQPVAKVKTTKKKSLPAHERPFRKPARPAYVKREEAAESGVPEKRYVKRSGRSLSPRTNRDAFKKKFKPRPPQETSPEAEPERKERGERPAFSNRSSSPVRGVSRDRFSAAPRTVRSGASVSSPRGDRREPISHNRSVSREKPRSARPERIAARGTGRPAAAFKSGPRKERTSSERVQKSGRTGASFSSRAERGASSSKRPGRPSRPDFAKREGGSKRPARENSFPKRAGRSVRR